MTVIDNTAVKDVICKSGTTFEQHVVYKINNVLQNTAPYRGKIQIRPYAGSPVVYYEANLLNGHLRFSGTDGGIHWVIPPNETDAFIWDRAYYDYFIQIAPGIVRRPLEGAFIVDRSVTSGIIP